MSSRGSKDTHSEKESQTGENGRCVKAAGSRGGAVTGMLGGKVEQDHKSLSRPR